MKEKKIQDILKTADDSTLRRLSAAAPLSEDDKERIFSESMRKLREKQNGSSPRIIMSRTGNSKTENTEMSQLRTGISKAIISAAAGLVLVLGLSGIFLLNSSKLDVTGPPAAASSESSEAEVLTLSSDDSKESLSSEETEVTAVTDKLPDQTPSEGTQDVSSAPDNEETASSEGTQSTSPATDINTSSASDSSSVSDIDYAAVTGSLINRLGDYVLFLQCCDIECDESVIYRPTFDTDVFEATEYTMDQAKNFDDSEARNLYVRLTDPRFPAGNPGGDMRALFRDSFTDDLLESQLSMGYEDYEPFYIEWIGTTYISLEFYKSRFDPYYVSYATEITDTGENSFSFTVVFNHGGSEIRGHCFAVNDNGTWKIAAWDMPD